MTDLIELQSVQFLPISEENSPSTCGKKVFDILNDGKYAIISNGLDIGTKIFYGIQNVPKFQAASSVARAAASSVVSSNLPKNSAPLVQLDSTTDGVGYVEAASSTCDVSGMANALILQEVIGTTVVIIVQVVSIYEVWKELNDCKKVIKESHVKIASIESDMQNLKNETEKLTQLIEEFKDKYVEQVTWMDTFDIIMQLNESILLYTKVNNSISELRIIVRGKIQTLKSTKNSLIRDEILCVGQIVAHFTELIIYAGHPMGLAFWGVKSVFTAACAAIAAIKGVQHKKTKKRVKKLKAIWQEIDARNMLIIKIGASLTAKQNMIRALHKSSRQL